jgi:TrmH family RNA methyltransferase
MPPNPRSRLRVVLVAPRNPLNIGAAARAMYNFGFASLRVVNPYEVAFREAKSAVRAAPLLAAAEQFASVADAVADCDLVIGSTSVGHRELQHPLRGLGPAARLIRRRLESDAVALLFGSEKFGLSNDDLSHCHWLLRIETAAPDQSMNLGQAVAVCLYELTRATRPAAATRKPKSASAAANEQITAMLLEALERSGYINPLTSASSEDKTRRLVRRLNLSQRDSAVVLGMLRQILWKLSEAGA